MSFLSRAWTGEETRTIKRLESLPKWSEESYGGGSVGAGDAMRLATVFSCVRILANSVSTLPLKAYRNSGDIRVPVDPAPKLFQDSPYPGITWHNWLWMMMQSLVMTGNAFGQVTAWEAGRPTAILPIHPDKLQITVPEDGYWTEPEYRINGKKVSGADIFHIKAYPTAGSPVSLSPVEMAATTLDLSAAADQYGLRWFRDSANPSGILSTEQDLTEAQVKRTMKSWMLSHRNRRLPAVMGGGIKWTPISITPEESQFLATRAYQRADIAMLFGIPPHMINDNSSGASNWGTGIEQQGIGFVVYTLMPWLICIEQAFTQILPRGQFAKFNADALLRGDSKARSEAHMIAVQNGWTSINEVRAYEEMEPIEGGDIHLQPANFVPLGYVPPEPTTSANTGEKGK